MGEDARGRVKAGGLKVLRRRKNFRKEDGLRLKTEEKSEAPHEGPATRPSKKAKTESTTVYFLGVCNLSGRILA